MSFFLLGLTATPEREKFYEVLKNLHIQDVAYYSTSHPEIKRFHVEEEFKVVHSSADEQQLENHLRAMKARVYENIIYKILE